MQCWPDDNDDDKPRREVPMWVEVLAWTLALTIGMVAAFNLLMGVMR